MHTLTCLRVCRIHIHARTRTCTGKVLQIFFFWRMANREKRTHTLAQQQPTVTTTNHKEREWKRIGQKEPKWKITKTLFQVTILAKMAAMEAETKLT